MSYQVSSLLRLADWPHLRQNQLTITNISLFSVDSNIAALYFIQITQIPLIYMPCIYKLYISPVFTAFTWFTTFTALIYALYLQTIHFTCIYGVYVVYNKYRCYIKTPRIALQH